MHILFFIYRKKYLFEPFFLCLSVDWFFTIFLDVMLFASQLLKPPLDNACAMLRMLAMLDSKPTRLSEQSIITLSNFLLGYLIDVVRVSIFILFDICL